MHPATAREETVPTATTPTPVLERLRQAACDHGDSAASAARLVGWARAFILLNDKRHPATLGLREVTHFLEHVVQTEKEPLVALAQARSASRLLYSNVLGIYLGDLPQPRPPRLLDQLRLAGRRRRG
jgi:hypothetical protein